MSKTRYELPDILRGLALINMIIYHACWDLRYLFDFDMPWYDGAGAYVWQQCICHTFILLSGFCVRFGKSPLKRGVLVLISSVIVSIGASVAGTTIKFGVLTLLGCGMCMAAVCSKWASRIPPVFGAAGSLTLFLCLRHITRGAVPGVSLPAWLYANDFTALLGFPPAGFRSSDYFPLLPWLFLFWCGYFLHGLFVQKGWMKYLHCGRFNLLGWLGRHSLYIYMLHQPLTYGILMLIL